MSYAPLTQRLLAVPVPALGRSRRRAQLAIILHRRAIELTPRRDVRSANEPDLLREAPVTKPAHGRSRPHTNPRLVAV